VNTGRKEAREPLEVIRFIDVGFNDAATAPDIPPEFSNSPNAV
jgi:hypothetical protein